MDLLKEISEKISYNKDLLSQYGLDSVITHIQIAEKHHYRAKENNDEHLYTDVIYRANHAFEGILKEAYEVLSDKDSSKKTPFEIEEYLLKESILKGRVVDLLTNYRKNWRNPSTHDYKLFFTEQESFLAIVNVSAFVSILIDQIIEKLIYIKKFNELEKAAILAREAMADFELKEPIDKVYKVLMSYSSYYLKHFEEMSNKPRAIINAEIAAFVKRVAPSFDVKIEPGVMGKENIISFDFLFLVDDQPIAIETRAPKPPYSNDESARLQLMENLRETGLQNGIVYHYPGHKTDTPVVTTNSSGWPTDLNIREVYSEDPSVFEDHEEMEVTVDLIANNG